MRRTWIKLFCDQTLHGSTFEELKPDERFCWLGFLLLAGDSPVDGEICLTKGVGYTDGQLAAMLKVPSDLLVRAKLKCLEFEKIKVIEGGVIKIVNWQRYQSEYQRQRKYRQALPPPKSPSFLKKQKKEEEGEGEGEEIVTPSCNPKLQSEVTPQSYNTDSNFEKLPFEAQRKIFALNVERQSLLKKRAQLEKYHAAGEISEAEFPLRMKENQEQIEEIDTEIRETREACR